MTSSACTTSCLKDVQPLPVRATYVNLYQWPESDAEFVRSVSSNGRRGSGYGHPAVVDSISCRQLYLRSYTFSRKEESSSVAEKTRKCLRRVREKVVVVGKRRKRKGTPPNSRGGGRRCVVIRRAKEMSRAALLSIFRRLLSCTTKVDVVG